MLNEVNLSPVLKSISLNSTMSQAVARADRTIAESANQLRRIIIDQSFRAGVGHIGSALSVADIINCLYAKVLKIASPSDNQRDRFILSKGHAALALYAAFYLKGWISQETLNTFCGNDSTLGVHPETILDGVDFSTGSLGQGLSFAAGAALAAKLQNSQRRVFVLMSDAELNEGSVWEAIMFAAHHKLSNLVVVIDLNGQQAFGYTKDVLNLEGLEARMQSFGFDVHTVDGHNGDEIANKIASFDTQNGAPHVIIAKTVFGKGVSFMEHSIKWHYSPLSKDEYQQAVSELEVVLK